MKERLELVTDFASLRAGDITVTRGCNCGQKKCRAMLISLSRALSRAGVEQVPAWMCVPECFNKRLGVPNAVSEGDVNDGIVYRVVDEQFDSEQRAQRRSREQPKKKQVRA